MQNPGPQRAVGYACSIMSDLPGLDPIRFTRELVEIESTTYHEGAVGDFLAGVLAARGWQVEKTPVPQPAESATAGWPARTRSISAG